MLDQAQIKKIADGGSGGGGSTSIRALAYKPIWVFVCIFTVEPTRAARQEQRHWDSAVIEIRMVCCSSFFRNYFFLIFFQFFVVQVRTPGHYVADFVQRYGSTQFLLAMAAMLVAFRCYNSSFANLAKVFVLSKIQYIALVYRGVHTSDLLLGTHITAGWVRNIQWSQALDTEKMNRFPIVFLAKSRIGC